MVLYEKEKRLPSDACQVYRVYSTLSTLYSLLRFTSFSSFSLLSLSSYYSNSLRYCVLHTIVDVSLRCLMIVVLSFSLCCSLILVVIPLLMIIVLSLLSCPYIHGYCSFHTQYQSQVISLFYPCFPQTFCTLQAFSQYPQRAMLAVCKWFHSTTFWLLVVG